MKSLRQVYKAPIGQGLKADFDKRIKAWNKQLNRKISSE